MNVFSIFKRKSQTENESDSNVFSEFRNSLEAEQERLFDEYFEITGRHFDEEDNYSTEHALAVKVLRAMKIGRV